MAAASSLYPFGDLLALARLNWVRQLSGRLAEAGYPGFRRGDAVAVRILRDSPTSIGAFAETLGISHQAARKRVDSLKARGYLREGRDPDDSRRVEVRLTERGEGYAEAVRTVLDALNAELASRVTADQLQSADTVLRAVLGDSRARHFVDRHIPPPDHD